MKMDSYDRQVRKKFRRKWRKALMLIGFYLVANLVADFFINKEVELVSSLAGAAAFGIFVTIGIFSRKINPS